MAEINGVHECPSCGTRMLPAMTRAEWQESSAKKAADLRAEVERLRAEIAAFTDDEGNISTPYEKDYKRLLTEVERLRGSEQRWVDEVVYYRNLAVMHGASPNEMRNDLDRSIAERGISMERDESDREYQPADERREVIEQWDEIDSLREALIGILQEPNVIFHGTFAEAARDRARAVLSRVKK